MPQAAIIFILAAAVSSAPPTMAPAWPMRLPGGAVWPAIKPTTGFYEISKLVAPEYLVEIEFTAIVIEKPLIQEGL